MPSPIGVPFIFIGGGNMASAIIRGTIAAGVVDPARLHVAEPDISKHGELAAFGVSMQTGAAAALDAAAGGHPHEESAIVLAVKPQMLATVANEIRDHVGSRLVITILAGVTTRNVREQLGGGCRVVRVMPNLPAAIGQGASAIARGETATAADEAVVHRLFAAVGPCVEHCDESLLDAFTAIAGSGPAYLFYLAEAMTNAAREFGFPADAADRIVRATLLGSASLLANSDQSSAALRQAVTSKGGTTNAATSVMDQAEMMATFARAFEAARRRGEELSRGG